MKCIIPAGGSGERLWPLSRELYPKFLFNPFGKDSLIKNIYEALSETVPKKNIHIVTNIRLTNDIKTRLGADTKSVIISEPIAKNTGAAVYSAMKYAEGPKDDIVVILPADFKVKDKSILSGTIKEAKKAAQKGYIAVIGIKPKYDESGYGYIFSGKNGVIFREKPSKEEIELLSKDNEALWNCGIYVSKLSVLNEEYKKYAPEEYFDLSKDMFDKSLKIAYEYYEKLPNISFDKLISEKTDKLYAVEMETEWYDCGSWNSIYKNEKNKDKNGNLIHGNVITDNVKDSLIYSADKLTTVSGVSDIITAETEDAVLVCNKSNTDKISLAVKYLKSKNEESSLERKTVYRPWGFYTKLSRGKGWLTKHITVLPGHKLSLQSHKFRSEHWTVLEGTATVISGDKTLTLEKRQSTDIPAGQKHSLQNRTEKILRILEVQRGDYIGEDDIVRYEDIYGRT